MKTKIISVITALIGTVFLVGLLSLNTGAAVNADNLLATLENRVATKDGKIFLIFDDGDCVNEDEICGRILYQLNLDGDSWAIDVDDTQLDSVKSTLRDGDNEAVLSIAIENKGTSAKTEFSDKNFIIGIGYEETAEDAFYDYLDTYACVTHGVIDMEFNYASSFTKEALEKLIFDAVEFDNCGADSSLYTLTVNKEEYQATRENYQGQGNGSSASGYVTVYIRNNASGYEFECGINLYVTKNYIDGSVIQPTPGYTTCPEDKEYLKSIYRDYIYGECRCSKHGKIHMVFGDNNTLTETALEELIRDGAGECADVDGNSFNTLKSAYNALSTGGSCTATLSIRLHLYGRKDGYTFSSSFMVTKVSGCTEPYYGCGGNTCTHSKTTVISAQDPTCTTAGRTEGIVCATCGYVIRKSTDIAPLNHVPGAAATCTTSQICTRCKAVLVKSKGHIYVHHAGKAPTCTEGGWDAYDTCERCDYSTYKELPKTQHTLIHHAGKAPTCTATGYSAYDTCENCDYSTYKALPKAQHTLIHHAGKAPTCTATGYSAYDTCENCDYSTYKALPKAQHILIHHDGKSPTCTATGYSAYDTCENCDYSTYKELPKAQHTLIHHDGKASTCTATGYSAYDTCGNCDYTTFSELPKASHIIIVHTAQTPTCTEYGWNEYETCAGCDYTTYEETKAFGHTFGDEWVVDRAATYTEKGEKSHHCIRCTEREDITEIPMLVKPAEPIEFSDVKNGAWYYNAVSFAVSNGLFNGMGDGKFAPDATMSRAMLVTVLWRMEGQPQATKTAGFTDLKQNWYIDAVNWAAEQGIVNGTGKTTFSPESGITREQMAKMFMSFCQYKKYDTSKKTSLYSFPDCSTISSWAVGPMEWTVAEGLMGGTDGMLAPKGSATRAQVATILMRFCEKYGE